jgi:hypothetical protein
MADPAPIGGSVANTAAVAVPTGAALIVLQYLVHPVWPPPDAVLTIVATALVPAVHLIGKAVMTRLTRAADKLDDGVVNASVDSAPLPAVVRLDVPPVQ